MFPIELFASDVEGLDFGVSQIRRLMAEDIEAMRRAQEKRAGLISGIYYAMPAQRDWSDFTAREMPWVLEVHPPPGDYVESDGLAHYLARYAESAFRITK